MKIVEQERGVSVARLKAQGIGRRACCAVLSLSLECFPSNTIFAGVCGSSQTTSTEISNGRPTQPQTHPPQTHPPTKATLPTSRHQHCINFDPNLRPTFLATTGMLMLATRHPPSSINETVDLSNTSDAMLCQCLFSLHQIIYAPPP